jgi:hypothetical protein
LTLAADSEALVGSTCHGLAGDIDRRSTLEIAVGIATILATVLALPPAWQFIRDRFDSSRKVRQQVLNALPNPKQKAIQSASTSYQARVNYILANELTGSDLESMLTLPAKKIRKALHALISEGKVQAL